MWRVWQWCDRKGEAQGPVLLYSPLQTPPSSPHPQLSALLPSSHRRRLSIGRSCASLLSRPFSGRYRRGHRPRSMAVRRVTSGLSFPKGREVHWHEGSISFQTGSSPDRPAGPCGGCPTCGPGQQAAPAGAPAWRTKPDAPCAPCPAGTFSPLLGRGRLCSCRIGDFFVLF